MVAQNREKEFQLEILRILERTGDNMYTRFGRDEIQRIIDYEFTSKELTEELLKSEINEYYSGLRWYDRLALMFKIKKPPPRIRAFEERLSDVLN